MQTSCPVDFHAIKGVSPVPPPSKVNHSTSWAGATVCEWQLVQLDPLVAKKGLNSPVAGLGPPRQDWLIHLGAGAVGDPYWRSRSAWCSIGSAAALVAPAAGPFPSVLGNRGAGGRGGGVGGGGGGGAGFEPLNPFGPSGDRVLFALGFISPRGPHPGWI